MELNLVVGHGGKWGCSCGMASLQSPLWCLTRSRGYFLSSKRSSSCTSDPAKLQAALARCSPVGRAVWALGSWQTSSSPRPAGHHHLAVPVSLSWPRSPHSTELTAFRSTQGNGDPKAERATRTGTNPQQVWRWLGWREGKSCQEIDGCQGLGFRGWHPPWLLSPVTGAER